MAKTVATTETTTTETVVTKPTVTAKTYADGVTDGYNEAFDAVLNYLHYPFCSFIKYSFKCVSHSALTSFNLTPNAISISPE